VGLRGRRGLDVVVRDRRAIVGLSFTQGDHLGAKWATHLRPVPRGKDSVIAVAMDAWRRHEPGQALKQLQRRQDEDGAPVGRGTW
jgi:hypothetical protein